MLDQDPDGLCVVDLSPHPDSFNTRWTAATRRVLHRLERDGLATGDTYFVDKGKPRIWKITDAGREIVRAFAGSARI